VGGLSLTGVNLKRTALTLAVAAAATGLTATAAAANGYPTISSFTVTRATTSTLTVAWTPEAPPIVMTPIRYRITWLELGVPGLTWTSQPPDYAAADSPVTLTGLLPEHRYQISISALLEGSTYTTSVVGQTLPSDRMPSHVSGAVPRVPGRVLNPLPPVVIPPPAAAPLQRLAPPARALLPRYTPARTYRTCAALNRVYPHGVARPGARDRTLRGRRPVRGFTVDARTYAANSRLDRDGDGIACEA
jgi:Excalibur calcium-binding domain/Fibronectin type III domain